MQTEYSDLLVRQSTGRSIPHMEYVIAPITKLGFADGVF